MKLICAITILLAVFALSSANPQPLDFLQSFKNFGQEIQKKVAPVLEKAEDKLEDVSEHVQNHFADNILKAQSVFDLIKKSVEEQIISIKKAIAAKKLEAALLPPRVPVQPEAAEESDATQQAKSVQSKSEASDDVNEEIDPLAPNFENNDNSIDDEIRDQIWRAREEEQGLFQNGENEPEIVIVQDESDPSQQAESDQSEQDADAEDILNFKNNGKRIDDEIRDQIWRAREEEQGLFQNWENGPELVIVQDESDPSQQAESDPSQQAESDQAEQQADDETADNEIADKIWNIRAKEQELFKKLNIIQLKQ